MKSNSVNCPLCQSSSLLAPWSHTAWKTREFSHCSVCDLVFVPESQQLSVEKERERYETHNNDLAAAGFRDFLMKTVGEIRWRHAYGTRSESEGASESTFRILDYGSGPEPSFSVLLREAGFEVVSYDPHFSPIDLWAKRSDGLEGSHKFDLVVTHEVFEHFREPFVELQKIEALLKPGGTFLIRSELRPSDSGEFSKWWYARDSTHVVFASRRTLEWIASKFGWELEFWSPVLWAFTRS